MQMKKVMISQVVSLKQYNTQSRISSEILEHCSSNLAPEMYIAKQNDTYSVVALAPVLSMKNQISSFVIF